MGPSLQLFGARFPNFSPSRRSRDFQFREMLISLESTPFYPRADRGQKLVIVTAGRPQQAVHVDGDGRQRPCGTFFIIVRQQSTTMQSAILL